ncbi:MAG: hypothetical protein ACFB10_19255 [Salibacteraceae bacterium]
MNNQRFSLRNLIIGIGVAVATVLILRFTFRLGFILVVLAFGIFLGYRWGWWLRKRQ